MNLVTRLFGFGASYNESSAKELVKIQSGQFYLSRPGQVRSSRECIYNNAMITIRRATSIEHQFQLVVTRIFEEGEEDILEEEEENDEKVFLISEELEFRTGSLDGELSLVWRDPVGDIDEVFEFVTTSGNQATNDFFLTCIYKAMYERKYRMNADKASDDDLAQFIWNGINHSTDTNLDYGTSAVNDNVHYTDRPLTKTLDNQGVRILISKPARLYMWDSDDCHFVAQEVVQAGIVKRDSAEYSYTLTAITDEKQKLLAHDLTSDLNPRWSNSNTALTWNNISSSGLMSSWCFEFKDKDDYEEFQGAFSRYLYEHMNSIGWEKTKADEKAYVMNSIAEDIEMGEPDDSSDEDAVESGLDAEDDEGETKTISPQNDAGEHNSHLTVGYKNGKTFVVRGNKLGVFGRTDENKLKYLATIKDLGFKGKKSFKPRNIMLHDQDTKMILMNPEEQHSLFSMDIERGKIVDEWKVHEDFTVDYIAPKTKFSPTSGEQTLVGASTNAIFRIDPRVGGRENKGNAMVESKQYAGKTRFSGITTTASGKLAVGGEKGDIKLFDTVGKIAKTALPAMGDPIIGIDVTADGRWIVATCKPYLLLIDTLIGEGKYAGSLGFDRAFPGNSKPQPRRLQLRGEHAAYMGNDISFTPARFNMGEGKEENAIVTSTGRFVIAWDFAKIKNRKGDSYVIKRLFTSPPFDEISSAFEHWSFGFVT